MSFFKRSAQKPLLLAAAFLFMVSTPARAEFKTREAAEAAIREQDQLIAKEPQRAAHYVQRAEAYYLLNDLQRAIDDFSSALRLDPQQDAAYFGRGMALARLGFLDAGIADLGVYIQRHPDSTVAYTKRGVRNIWKGDLGAAEQDLKRAVELDAHNAEAHDDLGVVFAKRKRCDLAVTHFATAIGLDPSYQKAYHNLGICFYISGQHQAALEVVDAGLLLDADNRSSLVLKAAILSALGHETEAQKIIERAEFLPEDNWTERSTLIDQGANTQP